MSGPSESERLLSLDLQVSFSGFEVVVDEDLRLEGITGIFGPSGGGKSTLLRVIAGLESGARGSVIFDGEVWQGNDRRSFVPAYRRPVGYVFQDARLFTHLDVAGNLKFAERRVGVSRGKISYDELVSAFDLSSLLDRGVNSLSGGERQRVAIARTLMTCPRLLLLDEPLVGLDGGRKSEILPYLDTLSSGFGIPVIYVSHSVDEMARLADRVVLLEEGRVLSHGTAVEVLNSEYVQHSEAGMEPGTIFEAIVREHLPDMQLSRLEFHGQSIYVPIVAHRAAGSPFRLHVRAGDVALAMNEPRLMSFRNVLRGKVSGLAGKEGSGFVVASVEVNGTVLRSRITRHACEELGLRQGMPVYALLKTASLDHRSPALT
jgi:molybdate transport system ATP-binding protein